MRRHSRSMVVFFLLFLFPFFINAPVHAAVVVNELLPKTEPSTQEWVELYNTGSETVSLDRWRLQNTSGTVKTYIFNASTNIAPGGFLTFTGAQTGINFAITGDSVQLFDEKNAGMDSQNFPGILGYNTTMGRTVDGGGTWVVCTTATFNTNNNCPIPSPQPTADRPLAETPIPITTPTPLPTNTPIPTPTPAPPQRTFGSFLPSPAETQVLGAAISQTPKPTPTADPTKLALTIDKILAFQILAVAIAWASIAVVAFVRRKRRIR